VLRDRLETIADAAADLIGRARHAIRRPPDPRNASRHPHPPLEPSYIGPEHSGLTHVVKRRLRLYAIAVTLLALIVLPMAYLAWGQKQPLQVGRPDQPQHSLGQYRDELLGLLQGVVERGTGRAAALPGLVGGKTGTTQDYRDAWFIGFDNALVVGVWVGNDDHSPMRRVTGGSLPAEIWKRFMMESAKGGGAPTAPSGTQVEAQQSPAAPAAPAAPAGAPAEQASRGVVDQANSNLFGLQSPQCNIPVCQRFYRSFRGSDCTYQPSRGGPRQVCDR
jgi:hypothetical protein